MGLKPYIPPCVFYGFKVKNGAMEATGENQCALTGRTCLMEINREKDKLNWFGCSLENKTELMINLGDVIVFSEEFPKGTFLRAWIRHVIDMGEGSRE